MAAHQAARAAARRTAARIARRVRTGPAGRHSTTALGRMHDDAGAVAIIVAISVSTFLLGFAALAVDFGQVYARQGELQSVADVAALAGASALPDAAAARRKALSSLCSDANRLPTWTDDGTCPADLNGPLPGWVTNGLTSDGEIALYARDSGGPEDGGDGIYQQTEEIANDGEDATAIRVKLPPSEVKFGLARSLGADDISVTKAATARLGTPQGAGVLPFAVTTQDLQLGADRQICVIDPEAGALGTYPGATDPPISLLPDPLFAIFPKPTLGDPLVLRRLPFFGRALPTNAPQVFIDGTGFDPVSASTNAIQVDLPELTAGSHQVWVESGDGTVVTRAITITVTGGGPVAPPPAGDPCEGRGRGVLDIARQDFNAPINDQLRDNIKHGIEPVAHRYNDFPNQILPILDPLLGTVRCNVLPLVFNVLASVVNVAFRAHINCVDSRESGFADGITAGLLDDENGDGDGGRLLQRCSDDDFPTRGRTIDGTDLFTTGSDLVNRDLGTGQTLLNDITSGSVRRDFIKGDAFRCPRLGMVPVIDPGGLNILDGRYPIVDFTYIWIDDDDTGLIYQGATDQLQGLKFHVVDPGFFGDTVTGSPKVGPFLGDEFPREVLLVRDNNV